MNQITVDGLRSLVAQFQQETHKNDVLDFIVWVENYSKLLDNIKRQQTRPTSEEIAAKLAKELTKPQPKKGDKK